MPQNDLPEKIGRWLGVLVLAGLATVVASAAFWVSAWLVTDALGR